MTFEEYRDNIFFMSDSERSAAKQVWNYQQNRIEKLEAELQYVRAEYYNCCKVHGYRKTDR